MTTTQTYTDSRVNAATRIHHAELARIKKFIADKAPTDGSRKMRITDAVRFLLDYYDSKGRKA